MTAKKHYFHSDYEKASKVKPLLKEVPYIIGGMVFTSQHTEARFLYEKFKTRLSKDALVIARFHMGLSYTRTSDYEQARHEFLENLKLERRETLSPISKFYAYQGGAFFRFYFAYNFKSKTLAHRGYQALLELNSPPPLLMALSLDLQAHNLVQIGQISRGLSFFKKALKITKEHKLFDLNKEMNISYHVYQSSHDDQPDKHLPKLKRFLKKQEYQNDYTQSNLVLQIAKLLILKGEFKEAHLFLKSQYETIYQKQDKRKVATLNTILAQLMIYKGQFIEAVSVIHAALTFLDPKVDKTLRLPLLGLKLKATNLLGQNEVSLKKEIQNLHKKTDRLINKKIQNRIDEKNESHEIGEDKLGDLIDRAFKKTPEAIDEIIQTRCLSLVYKYFGLTPGKRYILICQKPEATFTVSFDRVDHTNEALTKIQTRLLLELSKSKKKGLTKEEMIETIWGYKYESLRHDSLIYSNIARLRKALKDKGQWIFSDDNHYYLDSDIEVLQQFPPKKENSTLVKKESPLSEASPIESSSLNHRQLQTLSETYFEEAFSAQDYAEKWAVTRMTAHRDLKNMFENDYVVKVGQGKATRYLLKV